VCACVECGQFCELIEAQSDWEQCELDASREFVGTMRKSCDSFRDTMRTLTSGFELRKPEPGYEAEAVAFLARASSVPVASDGSRGRHESMTSSTLGLAPETIVYFADLMRDWCLGVERCVLRHRHRREQDTCPCDVCAAAAVVVVRTLLGPTRFMAVHGGPPWVGLAGTWTTGSKVGQRAVTRGLIRRWSTGGAACSA
jgi:hypothetical protein